MWKVTRTCEYGLIGEDEFYTFEEAKIQFRHIIKEKLGDGICEFTKQIEGYCKEFYPDHTPKEMTALMDLLTKLATDPNYPPQPEEFVFDDFEDDNIEFYMDGYTKRLYLYVNNEEVEEKFPQAEIHVIQIDDPDEEYYFFITDNRNPGGGKHFSTNITLSNSKKDNND